MTPIRPVSRERLAQRRSRLKRRRRVQRAWGGWQSLVVMALLGATGWLITAPIWVVRSPEQITIEGNTHLDGNRIRQLLGLTYPQSLWRLKPDAIADSLKARAPLDQVRVTRQLLPPGLTVHVQELRPVAVVQLSSAVTQAGREGPDAGPQATNVSSTVGLIDHKGTWIELSRYQQGEDSGRSLPPLKLIAPKDRLSKQWPNLYRQIKLAPIRISTIQWHDPNNLILETELGTVHLGPFGPNFNQQLAQLASLRNLPSQIDNKTLAYIDLRDPNAPLLQMEEQHPTTAPSP